MFEPTGCEPKFHLRNTPSISSSSDLSFEESILQISKTATNDIPHLTLEKCTFENAHNIETPKKATTNRLKTPQVTFGRDLSPQIFDTKQPANTPIRRGEIPQSRSKKFLQSRIVQQIRKSPRKILSKLGVLKTPKNTKQKSNKVVSFNRSLSPEIFDTNLPVSTPLSKGEIPRSRLLGRNFTPRPDHVEQEVTSPKIYQNTRSKVKFEKTPVLEEIKTMEIVSSDFKNDTIDMIFGDDPQLRKRYRKNKIIRKKSNGKSPVTPDSRRSRKIKSRQNTPKKAKNVARARMKKLKDGRYVEQRVLFSTAKMRRYHQTD